MRMLAALLSFAFASAALAADPASADAKAPAAAPAAATLPGPVDRVAAPAPSLSAPPAYGKSSGIFPGLVIGPKLALLPIPNVIGVGLEAKFQNLIGVGLDYNFFPTLKVADVKLGYNDVSLAARVFPWQGRFYLGAALGRRTFFAKVTDSSTGQEIKGEVAGTYLAPEIGWRFVWGGGFFMGIDLGYQLMLSSKVTITVPGVGTADVTDQQNVQDATDNIGKVGLPIISLLQFGYYF